MDRALMSARARVTQSNEFRALLRRWYVGKVLECLTRQLPYKATVCHCKADKL